MRDGMDFKGAARDMDTHARRWAPIYAQPDVEIVAKMLHRNPWAATAIRRAFEAELAANPERAVSLEVPVFGSDSHAAQRGAAHA